MRYSLSLLFGLVLVATLQAETRLVLGNGDSLRGEVVKVEDGVIHFQSDALGLLTLPSTGVTLEETDPAKSVAKSSREQSPPAQNEPDGPVVVKKVPWKKDIEFGFTLQSGRKNLMDISGRFSAQRNIMQDQYRVQARYLYSENNSIKSNDLLDSSFRWRRDFTPRMFTQALTAYGFDQIKHINHDFSQGVGVGRKFYNLDTFNFSLGGGATARYRDERGDPDHMNYMVDAFQDMDYQINKIFRVSQDASVRLEPDDPDNYEFQVNAALIGKITSSISMSMRYEYQYDNSLSLANKLNQRIITSLGYLW